MSRLSVLRALHRKYIYDRRSERLADIFASLIPENSKVLDIGCGNGLISHRTMSKKASLQIEGLDILARPEQLIPITVFDGSVMPFADNRFDVCMLVDTLHHATQPEQLLKEAVRVSRRYILIKDHYCDGRMDNVLLKLMDWVGDRPHGVVLPYNYLGRKMWNALFTVCGIRLQERREALGMYVWPLEPIIGHGLHFVDLLEKK